jgi:hypothetical protein
MVQTKLQAGLRAINTPALSLKRNLVKILSKLVVGVLILKKKYRAILLKENESKTLLND